MIKSIAENRWVRQIAVALGYALVYTVLRPYSGGVWTVTAGLRLSCLLLFPPRYWPALIVGECAAIVPFYYPMAERFGTLWVVVSSIPPMLVAAPVVWWCTRKLGDVPLEANGQVKGAADLHYSAIADLGRDGVCERTYRHCFRESPASLPMD
jgi:hypothetical protein